MSIRNNLLTFFVVILLTTIYPAYRVYAGIISTYSLNSPNITDLLQKINKSSLVVVNIDDTIIIPKSKMFNYGSPYRGIIEELKGAARYVSTANSIIARLLVQRKMSLVEQNWPNFINQLKNSGAIVLGITRTKPEYKQIKDFEKLQYQQLINLGIKFTEQVNGKDIFKFDENNKNSSSFYRGIIVTYALDKAQEVEELLNTINIPFNNIIVFDNNKSTLMNINNSLKTREIDYYGIEYLAATLVTEAAEKNVVEFQRQRLFTTGEWLEDDIAKKLMNKQD